MKFLGQRSDLRCSCDLCHSCGNAKSLTHSVGLGIKPASQRSRGATNPVVPQWELYYYYFFFGLIYLLIYF